MSDVYITIFAAERAVKASMSGNETRPVIRRHCSLAGGRPKQSLRFSHDNGYNGSITGHRPGNPIELRLVDLIAGRKQQVPVIPWLPRRGARLADPRPWRNGSSATLAGDRVDSALMAGCRSTTFTRRNLSRCAERLGNAATNPAKKTTVGHAEDTDS